MSPVIHIHLSDEEMRWFRRRAERLDVPTEAYAHHLLRVARRRAMEHDDKIRDAQAKQAGESTDVATSWCKPIRSSEPMVTDLRPIARRGRHDRI